MWQRNKHILQKVVRLLRWRFLQHTVFWLLTYAVLLQHFATSSQINTIDAVYTAIFLIPLVVITYFNLLFLIPRLLEKGRYVYYFLGLVPVLFFGVELHGFAFHYLVDRLFPGFYLISYFDRPEVFRYVAATGGITTLLHFSKSWLLLRESENQRIRLLKEKSEAELQGLKAQVNPHFLFNTLNSILSLISPQNHRARNAVLWLADSLRYIIYESGQRQVLLSRELEYLSNYLELQRLRSSEKDSFEFHCQGDTENRKIAPLLILPLVENAFKHGIKGLRGKAFVHIQILLNETEIKIIIENSRSATAPGPTDETGGFGLDNLRKRLELEYPGQHRLNLESQGEIFRATLSLWSE